MKIARRPFLKAMSMATIATTTGGLSMRCSRADAKASAALLARVDHLVYATPDLDLAIDKLEKLLGVRATPGGPHPGRGTRNALIALGPATYLEIFGPDPEQPKPEKPRGFGVDDLQAPRIAAWLAHEDHLDQLVSKAALQGVKLGKIIPGSRKRPDGVVLSWHFTDPATILADGIVPIFIDWGQTPHPAGGAAKGATLVDFRAEHPDPQPVKKMLSQLGLVLPVQTGLKPALIVTIACPRGRVDLS